MSYFENYIKLIQFEETKHSVREVADKIFKKYLSNITNNKPQICTAAY